MLKPSVHDLPRSGFSAKHGFSARLRRGLEIALLGLFALPMLPVVTADVGLPDYAGPLPQPLELSRDATAATVDNYTLRSISLSTSLSCNGETMKEQSDRVLDFAPPGDFRPALHHHLPETSAEIPLVIRGNRAVMQMGNTASTADVRLHDGRLLLISADNDFFKSLQTIQADDRLLVQTPHTVRQYRITRARLTRTLSHEADAASESLSLVACYPFQTVGSKPIFYEVRALSLGSALPSVDKKAGVELISF